MTKVYRFASTGNNRYNINKIWSKTYNLAGLNRAIKTSHWVNHNKDYLEVVEYELKEIRRLALDEVKQLNTQQLKDKLVYVIDLVSNKNNLDIQFSTNTTGCIWDEKVDEYNHNLKYYDKYEFNSLDEAIAIVSKY